MIDILSSQLIPVGKLHGVDWNPNEQTDATFNELVEEIKEDGFDHPLNVCPCTCDKIEGEHWKIIGGHHRHKAALVLEMTELPCMVNDKWDEQKQKLKTVRRNLLTGELNDVKFTKLVKDLNETYEIPAGDLPRMLGFNDERDFARHYIQEREAKTKSFLDELVSETKKEGYAVDTVTDLISTIFAEAGETIDQDFLSFGFKGSVQTVVLLDKEAFVEVKKMISHLGSSGETATDFIKDAIKRQLVDKKNEADLISSTDHHVETL